MNYHELEYKYQADHVNFRDFHNLMVRIGFSKHLTTSSWDIYYTSQDAENDFQRFRMCPNYPELTRKVKTSQNDNFARVEVDLPLDPTSVTEDIVTKYVSLKGYKENFRVFKSCDIYWQDVVNYVLYVVSDADRREVGRFIEVEVNKPKVAALNVQGIDTTLLLKSAAACLKELKVDVDAPIKKSLFEMYYKG